MTSDTIYTRPTAIILSYNYDQKVQKMCEGVLWHNEHKAQTAFRMWSNSCHRGPLKSVQHELSSGSSTHREGATPTRFGPRPRNRDRMPSFSRMALQKEMNREISRITKLGALLFLLLCSSVLLVASSPHLLCYPFCDLLSFSLQPLLLSPSVISSYSC